MAFDYKELDIKEIEKDLEDAYSKYSDEDKFECMGIDIVNLIKCVKALREELQNR
jgi:hypothetical protein